MPESEPFTPHEFLQDFLNEAEEHLQSMRQNLLALEGSLAEMTVEAVASRLNQVNELFRSMHTLKGLCGMVGLAQGEELSHQMETVLGGVKRMEVEISPQLIDILLAAVQSLEAVIAPLRDPSLAAPDIGHDLDQLACLLPPIEPPAAVPLPVGELEERALVSVPASTAFLEPVQAAYPEIPAALAPLELRQLEAAHKAGKYIILSIFTPTPEKAARSVSVNQVREQMGTQVELVKSMPLIGAAGIRFAFLGIAGDMPEPERFIEMEWIYISPPTGVLAAARPAQAPIPAAQPGTLSTYVRVDLAQLDDLMHMIGDLIVLRARLGNILPKINGASTPNRDALEQTVDQMGRRLGDLRQAIMRTRMVPLAEVFAHMPLAVRDLARSQGKEVRLELSGEHTQIDKQLVERLLEPLMHLVRNAITHGIETPSQRRNAGKPPVGRLSLIGQPEGDHILVTVADDGGGVNPEAVATKAASMGWIEPGTVLTDGETLDILCRPGFTTRAVADLASGRGLGMEIVTQFIHSVGGSLTLRTVPGHGAAFILRLPLTLTIVDALIVQADTERYAIQQSAVDVVLEIDPQQIVPLETREIYPYREGALTLFRLDRLLRLNSRSAGDRSNRPGSASRPRLYGLVSSEGEQSTALVVDRLLGLREVVVRTITDPLVAQPGIIGATELGDGSVILILDLNTYLHAARAA